MDDPEIAYVVDLGPGGNEECTTLAIYQNLASAFRHLRYVDQVRIFWVDAICIHLDRSRTKYCRNSRFEPLFSEGVGLCI
jgi:hypothetical protein